MVAIAQPQRAAAPARDTADDLARPLALGWWLVGVAEAFGRQLDRAALGDIDLPPVVGSAGAQAQLRALAPLYLAAEVEQAGLLPAVELLAGLYASGGLPIDLGEAGPAVLTFWRGRHQRFARGERQALFGRLFGTPSGTTLAAPGGANGAFEGAMIDLTEALHRLATLPALGQSPWDDGLLRVVARQLADNLARRDGGVATFAARDLLATIQEGVTLLKQPALQQALGVEGVWGAVRWIAGRYFDALPASQAHIERGRAGMLVLTWLAAVLPLLDDPAQRLMTPGPPVLLAATAWLQASLALAERGGAWPLRG